MLGAGLGNLTGGQFALFLIAILALGFILVQAENDRE